MFSRVIGPWIVLGLALVVWAEPARAGLVDDQFDDLFRKAYKRHLGRVWDRGPAAPGWHWLKAQAYAESGFDPMAVSPVGARGLAQFMPGTSAGLSRDLSIPDRPFDPLWATTMQAAYLDKLRRFWSSPRPERERIRLVLASYNAGPGNILKAQRLARSDGCDPAAWACVAARLPEVTGRYSAETRIYVDRIECFRGRLLRARLKTGAEWFTSTVSTIGAVITCWRWGARTKRLAAG